VEKKRQSGPIEKSDQKSQNNSSKKGQTNSFPFSQPMMASFSNMWPQEVMVGSFMISRVIGHRNSLGTLGRSAGFWAAAAAANAATAAAEVCRGVFPFLSISTPAPGLASWGFFFLGNWGNSGVVLRSSKNEI